MEEVENEEHPIRDNIFLIIFGVFTLILIIVSLTFITMITGSVIGPVKLNYTTLFVVFVILALFVFLEMFFFFRHKKKKMDLKKLIEEQQQN